MYSMCASIRLYFCTPRTSLQLLISSVYMQYEPELFPGLIYRMKDPKVVLLIFVSGKVVLTGGCDLVHAIWYVYLYDTYANVQQFRAHWHIALAETCTL